MPMEEQDEKTGLVMGAIMRNDKGGKHFGICIYNEEMKHLEVCQFLDNDYFTMLEALLLQTQPSCCWMVEPLGAIGDKIKDVFENCKVELKTARVVPSSADTEGDLERLINGGTKRHLAELRQADAMKACQTIITECELHRDDDNYETMSMSSYLVDGYMRLDNAVFTALNLLPRPGEGVRTPTSLVGFLNKCRTSVGSRRLLRWVSQPLTDPKEIKARHDMVEMFVEDECFRSCVVNRHLSHVPDIDKIAGKFHRISALMANSKKGAKNPSSISSIEDLVRMYNCILSAGGLLKEIYAYHGPFRQELLDQFGTPLDLATRDFEGFVMLVEKTIDLAEAVKNRKFMIAPQINPVFMELAKKKRVHEAKMDEIRQKFCNKGNFTNADIRIIENPRHGKVLRTTKKLQKKVSNMQGVVTVQLNKNEFQFTTQDFKRACTDYAKAQREYESEQTALVNKALNVAATYYPIMEKLATLYGSLDIMCSFALVSSCSAGQFVRAEIDESGADVQLKDSRHVLVEELSERGFISNDIIMNKEDSRFFMITGPNMGGKSTFIRQAALIALMNQIGMFVPCSKAKLPIFDALMCRVGASDLQLRGLSTFMAEMLEASCILKTATPKTLVLVDELGRGTSTFDGFGLAWAIASHLLNKTNCFCLFATHFQELSNLSQEQKGCVNRYVDATVTDGQLTFHYEIKDGFVDQSYGVHVAKMADFPERVVGNAKRKADELEGKSDQVDLDEGCKRLKDLIQATAVDDFKTFLSNLPTALGSLKKTSAAAGA